MGAVEVSLTGRGLRGNLPPLSPQTTVCRVTASYAVACRQAFCESLWGKKKEPRMSETTSGEREEKREEELCSGTESVA